MRKYIESLIEGALLCIITSLLFVSSAPAQNFKIRKYLYLEEKKFIVQDTLIVARDVNLTLNDGYEFEEFPRNCGGGFDFLPDGDVIAIDSGNPPEIFIFDANGDGVPAIPQHIANLNPGYFGSFIKVSLEGDYALFGSTAGTYDPHYIEKIDLSDYSITQIVQLQGNFDLVFMDNHQVLISANADENPETPNCIHYLDVNHPEEMRVIASIDETSSGPIELNDAGNLYYLKSTHFFPPPPDSHHLLKFTAAQVYNAITQEVVLGETDSQIDIEFDSGYNMESNSFNDLFVADLYGNIYKVDEKNATKELFCQRTDGGGFSYMAFYKPYNFFNPYQESPSRLAAATNDMYWTELSLLALSPELDDSFVDEVLDFSPGLGGGGDTELVLGPPVGGGTYTPSYSSVILLGDRDNPDENSPATVDLKFNHSILDDAQNLYGLDLIVFGNSFWIENDPHNRFTEPALIEVSKDLNHNSIADDEWFLILPNILPDDLGPLNPVEYYTMTLRNYGEYSPTLILGDIDGDNEVEIENMDPEVFYTVPDRLCYEGDEQSYLVDAYSGAGDASDLREAVVQVENSPGVPFVDEFGHKRFVHLDRVDFVRLRDARNGDMHISPFGMVTAKIDAVADAKENLVEAEPREPIVVSNVNELEAALSTAVQGDEIVLEPGVYIIADTLVMPLGVSLRGSAGLWTVNYGDDDAVIDGNNLMPGIAAISLIDPAGSYSYKEGYEISGIHFKNCPLAIYVEDMYPTIQHNLFEDVVKAITLLDCRDERVVLRNNIFGHQVLSVPEVGIEADNTNLALTHNDFVNFSQEAVLLRNACEVYLRDNIFANNEIGLYGEDPGYVYGHYNVLYGNNTDYNFSVGTIEDDILADPCFAFAAQGDYRLTVDSPVRAQSMGGADPGVYDGPNFYPFDIAIGYYLDLNKFPWYEAIEPAEQYSGAAVAKMWLSYLWWDNTVYPEPPEYPQTQEWLYEYGHPENYECNSELERLDARGLWYTVQTLDPPYNPYHYNFSIYKKDIVEEALNAICHWIAYPAGGGSANPYGYGVDGYPVHVPAAVTAYGNYDNWMAIRGIRTTENPYETSSYGIFGFWINDPCPSSIGANTYKTATQWTENYYYQLTDINPNDPCYNKWVSILEPPERPAKVKVLKPKTRLKQMIEPTPAERVIAIDGVDIMVSIQEIKDGELLDVVKAAIDAVNEELIPYDPEFAGVFSKTVAGQPLLVSDDNGGYYLVPFEAPIKKRPVKLNKDRTLVVVLIDAQDGSFKEASWVNDPVKYLPVSVEDALKIVFGEIGKAPEGAVIELVHSELSPYYPVWKIQIGSRTYIVNQQGELSIGGKLLRKQKEYNLRKR